jgi:hypothetical protein
LQHTVLASLHYISDNVNAIKSFGSLDQTLSAYAQNPNTSGRKILVFAPEEVIRFLGAKYHPILIPIATD